jgi:hypothetical protein
MSSRPTKGRRFRQAWWAIVRSVARESKTYHTLNVAHGAQDRPVVVTTSSLAAERTGAFAMCVPCRSNACEHALFVAECVTMGVTTIGAEAHRDSMPLPTEPPPDLEQWSVTDDGRDEERND